MFFFKILPSNLVLSKCPERFLYYIQYVEWHVQKISEFHVFGWFPGLQNLDVFLEKFLWSYLGRSF